MHIESKKRDLPDPWYRDIREASCTADDMNYIMNYAMKQPKFSRFFENLDLDIYTKRAALRASVSVVSLISYSGGDEIFQGSGTVIESDDTGGIILTSADLIRSPLSGNSIADAIKVVVHLSDDVLLDGQIVAFDFHYNIVVVKIQTKAPLTIACLRHLDDSITVDPSEVVQDKPFQLRPHSNSYNLIPGDRVIALGRYFVKPHALMAAPGEFSINQCEYQCKELFRANCSITRCGVGGPLINRYGEVIGICFYDCCHTPFLPVNLASKWWNRYKKYGETRRPWLAMELTNLYAVRLDILEKIIQKFPNTFKGVMVEEVIPGSSAHSAGIRPNDVIVQFGGKTILSFLELLEVMWDKVGDPVELVVLRASDGVRLHFSMVVDEATPEKFYSWPLLNNAR
ncbi:putative protease Do-like 14 [Ricinus communis]|uniref:putative protease Do-like 14 n=1 Tax=Ricinus communis TaxID=3988 RepID=UPI0007723DCB|nr:putative protease Do-like 14 [Ricinus communis]XP_015576314.1 putative protease Do-like 14 [Ricinus communis]|eukprot:XP_015576313.1 putative protease Do-like 14 [Ricinus communis]